MTILPKKYSICFLSGQKWLKNNYLITFNKVKFKTLIHTLQKHLSRVCLFVCFSFFFHLALQHVQLKHFQKIGLFLFFRLLSRESLARRIVVCVVKAATFFKLHFPNFWWPDVNFINVLWAAFKLADPKSAKKTDNLTVFCTFGIWARKICL